MKVRRVKKAVISAAGLGTHMLPMSKALPKHMLPLVDKPIVQHIVEDLVDAGITEIIFVTNSLDDSVQRHFTGSVTLEDTLRKRGMISELAEIQKISRLAKFHFVHQKGGLGNAVPIINSSHLLKDEPFLVVWADDFIRSSTPWIRQLVAAYDEMGGGNILSCIRSDEDIPTTKQAFAIGREVCLGTLLMKDIVDKPAENFNYEIVNGAIYEPEMIRALTQAKRRKKSTADTSELSFVDGVRILLETGARCYAREIKNGKYYNCGNKLDYLKTVLELAIQHKEYGKELTLFLKTILPS